MRVRIEDLEARLTAAERSGDRAVLQALLAEDFTGVLANGRRVDKAGFIAAFCDSGLSFTSMQIGELQLRTAGNLALVNGRSQYAGSLQDRAIAGSAQFLDCWQETLSGWHLLASSVTPEPSAR